MIRVKYIKVGVYMEKFHEHDCECCKYLGSEVKNKDSLDYYVCEQDGKNPTVIARFGENGDYFSGIFAVKYPAAEFAEKTPGMSLAQAVLELRGSDSINSKELFEATARAIEQGFLDESLRFTVPTKKLKM